MNVMTARRTLATARAALGVAAIVAPRVTGRAFGIDMTTHAAAPYVLRLFGARELYMASPFLLPGPGLDEGELAARAVPVDVTDAVAAVAAGARGYLPWPAATMAAATAAVGAWLGTVASREV